MSLIVVACGSATPPPTGAPSQVAGVPSSAPSVSAAPSATPAPTATPSPTSAPTPAPWLTYGSNANRYTIKYPPGWTVYAGDADTLDEFDSHKEARFYVGHGVETTPVSVADFVRREISYFRVKFKGTVVSNKAIKLVGGYSGRIVELLGEVSGTKVSISHIFVAKGESWYNINFWLDDPATSPGRELFPEIYGSWRPV
jgi:hypothetical protein